MEKTETAKSEVNMKSKPYQLNMVERLEKKITEYGKEKKTPSTPIKQFEKKI